MLLKTWDPCWEYDVHSCGSFFLFYPVIYLELYLYIFSSHSASFSPVPCWSLIISLPGLSWHQGLLLAQQCCPRSDTPLPYSWCSQSFCSHKGEAEVTWTQLRAIWNCAKTNPLVLTPCTANSVQHLQLFISNGKFMFPELQQQTFWPSDIPPPFSI